MRAGVGTQHVAPVRPRTCRQDVLPSKQHILWIESICNDEEIIAGNIASTKASLSPGPERQLHCTGGLSY